MCKLGFLVEHCIKGPGVLRQERSLVSLYDTNDTQTIKDEYLLVERLLMTG